MAKSIKLGSDTYLDESGVVVDANGTTLEPSLQDLGASITHNANITNIEKFRVYRYGRVIILEMVFTVGTAITGDQEELFSGLPKAIASTRFRLDHGYSASVAPLVLGITPSGTIINQWSTPNIGPGQYQGQCAYLCS